MQNNTLLVHQITGEELLNTIRNVVEGSIEKRLAPVINVIKRLDGATIEKRKQLKYSRVQQDL
jgi:hypothetical protein